MMPPAVMFFHKKISLLGDIASVQRMKNQRLSRVISWVSESISVSQNTRSGPGKVGLTRGPSEIKVQQGLSGMCIPKKVLMPPIEKN